MTDSHARLSAGSDDSYSNDAIADRLVQTFIATGDRWFNIAAKRMRGVAQPSREAREKEITRLATIEECARIADNNGWEATAAQIRALAISSTDRGGK